MNIQKARDVAAQRPLAGKLSLVMGSTSTIGRGIFREKVIHDPLLAQQPNRHFAAIEDWAG
jgi:hypothetical protein